MNYGLGQVIPKVVGFLLLPLYTAFLSPEDFGIVDLTMTIGAFALSGMRLGLPGAISVFYFDYVGKGKDQVYISTLYIGTALISFVLSVPFLVVGYFVLPFLVPGLPFYPFYFLIILSSFLNTSSDIQKRLLQVREQSGYSAWLNIITTLAGILTAVILVVLIRMGALGMVLSTLLTSVIFFIQAQIYLKKDLRFIFDKTMFRNSLVYSLPLLPYHVLGNFAPLFGKSILAAQSSLAAVGLFAIAFKLTQPMQVFSNALGTAYSPIYFSMRTSEGTNEVNRKVVSAFNKIWAISTILSVAIYLFATPALVFFTDIRYHGADVCVKILSLGFLPTVFYLIASQEIFYQKKTRIVLLINLTAALLTILLAMWLVPKLDEVGLAVSMVAPLFISAIGAHYFSSKYYMIAYNWSIIFRTSCVALSAMIMSHFLPDMPMFYSMLALVSIFLISFWLIAWLEKSMWISAVAIFRKSINP